MHTCTPARANTCKGIDFPQVFFLAKSKGSDPLQFQLFFLQHRIRDAVIPSPLRFLRIPEGHRCRGRTAWKERAESKGGHTCGFRFFPKGVLLKRLLGWIPGSGKGDSPTISSPGSPGGAGLTVHRGIFQPRSSAWRAGSGICPPGETLERGRRGQAGGTLRWWDPLGWQAGLPRPASRSQPRSEMKREGVFWGIFAPWNLLWLNWKNQTVWPTERKNYQFFF